MASKENNDKPNMTFLAETSEEGFVGTCFAIVGVGFLGAVKYSMNKDKEVFKKNKVPAMYAAKALLYGTLLCVGTFASAGALVVFTTGISNAKDFGKAMRKAFGNRIPDEEFEKDHEIEFDSLKQDMVDFFVANDETNQASDLLLEKPKVEVLVEVPEADKPPRESPILSLFKDSNGEYSKKSPVLAWLREKRADLLGHPKPVDASSSEVKVDAAMVKEIVESALNEESTEPVVNITSSESVGAPELVVVSDSRAGGRTWMQFWSETVYGTSDKTK